MIAVVLGFGLGIVHQGTVVVVRDLPSTYLLDHKTLGNVVAYEIDHQGTRDN